MHFSFSNSRGGGYLDFGLVAFGVREAARPQVHVPKAEELYLQRAVYRVGEMLRRPLRAELSPIQLGINQALLSLPTSLIKT